MNEIQVRDWIVDYIYHIQKYCDKETLESLKSLCRYINKFKTEDKSTLQNI